LRATRCQGGRAVARHVSAHGGAGGGLAPDTLPGRARGSSTRHRAHARSARAPSARARQGGALWLGLAGGGQRSPPSGRHKPHSMRARQSGLEGQSEPVKPANVLNPIGGDQRVCCHRDACEDKRLVRGARSSCQVGELQLLSGSAARPAGSAPEQRLGELVGCRHARCGREKRRRRRPTATARPAAPWRRRVSRGPGWGKSPRGLPRQAKQCPCRGPRRALGRHSLPSEQRAAQPRSCQVWRWCGAHRHELTYPVRDHATAMGSGPNSASIPEPGGMRATVVLAGKPQHSPGVCFPVSEGRPGGRSHSMRPVSAFQFLME
jgi:hypothetical protein